MRAVIVQALAAGALAAAITAPAAAQPKDSSALLTAAQVRAVATKASTPAEHAQLRDHFLALAEQYDADARRFSTKGLAGNPNRRSGIDYDAQWKRLGETAADMAKSARELAGFHGQLASGAPATHPGDSAHVAHLERGAGAPTVLSDAALQKLVASARTPSDHAMLAEYFTGVAAKYTQDANRHEAMALGYRGNPRSTFMSQAADCDRLSKKARMAASDAKGLAAAHEAMAK